MFGGNSSGSKADAATPASDSSKSPSPESRNEPLPDGTTAPTSTTKSSEQAASGEKRSGNGSPPSTGSGAADQQKKRRSGVGSKASHLLASAKNSLNFSSSGKPDVAAGQTPLQKLGKQDPALAVPQGQHNNSAGESLPGPRSTFRVGVWEDRNKKCRRTMEDTHAFLYNFLHTPAPALGAEAGASKPGKESAGAGPNRSSTALAGEDMMETDNGYFAIFDGHAGTFAADWCGKKLHLILEDTIRKHPNAPIPELLDQTFTNVDAQLEKLPLKNSGCTAAIAVLRWEDRVPSSQSATGSQAIAPAVQKAAAAEDGAKPAAEEKPAAPTPEAAHAKLKSNAFRQRVLYTANVGDARIVLCRGGKALRLSYDHKGSDEYEGKRIANAGGLILNNRVNGVLAVTRALGDTYMKDLVTGHPYTTETVIQPDADEFMIIACDGVWDVCNDQEAVDLVRNMTDPVAASKFLVDHALSKFSTDNLSCMIVRFDRSALAETQKAPAANLIGVEGDPTSVAGKPTETEKIISTTKQKIAEGDTPAVGVSASNSGRGHDPIPIIESGSGELDSVAEEGDATEGKKEALENGKAEPATA